jgi:hypothetical protein
MTRAPERVSKADIERKLRKLQGGVEESVASQRQKIIGGAVAVGVLTLLLVFLLGKRSGRKKNTVVEIRRF